MGGWARTQRLGGSSGCRVVRGLGVQWVKESSEEEKTGIFFLDVIMDIIYGTIFLQAEMKIGCSVKLDVPYLQLEY